MLFLILDIFKKFLFVLLAYLKFNEHFLPYYIFYIFWGINGLEKLYSSLNSLVFIASRMLLIPHVLSHQV